MRWILSEEAAVLVHGGVFSLAELIYNGPI